MSPRRNYGGWAFTDIISELTRGGIMFDLKNLGDMAKLAGEAKQLQREQQKTEQEKIQLLMKISRQLDEVLAELKKR